jgi:hypothetical protein
VLTNILENIKNRFSSHKSDSIPSEEECRSIFYGYAKNGHTYDQFSYGYCCLYGYGGPVNLGHAEYWLNLSANNGVVDAQFVLGECYFKGTILKKDLEKAKYWLIVAATNEHEEAKYYVENEI